MHILGWWYGDLTWKYLNYTVDGVKYKILLYKNICKNFFGSIKLA